MLEAFSKRDRALFEELRNWRSERSKEMGKPPYVIFKDATLIEIVETKPTTTSSLQEISGIGEKKIQNYGQDVLGIVQNYI